MKLVFIKDKKIFERKFDEFFTAHKNNKTMQEVHEELSQITRKFAWWYHKKTFTAGLFWEPFLDLSQTKIAKDLQSLLKDFKQQNQENKLDIIYTMLTKCNYTDWVFTDANKDLESEIKLKNGGEKIRQFYKHFKGKSNRDSSVQYSNNIIRKICVEWLKCLDFEISNGTKSDIMVKDFHQGVNFIVSKKELRCSWSLNESWGISWSHILSYLKDKDLKDILKGLYIHPRFHKTEKLVKQESGWNLSKNETDSKNQTIKIPSSIFSYENAWKIENNKRKHGLSNSPAQNKHKRIKYEDDQCDSLWVNIDSEDEKFLNEGQKSKK